jgi:vacuolar-type H+-ATPase subunit C/Vma6
MSFVGTTLRHDFVYFFGRLAIIKPALLTDSDRNRLLGADSLADFVKVILELPFTKFIHQGASNPELVFSALQSWLEREIHDGVHANFQTVLLLPILQNYSAALSIALKKQHNFATNENALLPNDSITAFEEVLTTGTSTVLPVDLIDIAKNISKQVFHTPQEIDAAVAGAFALYSVNVAKKSGSATITKFVQTSIDTINVKVALRSANANELLPGGKIDRSVFANNVESWKSSLRKAEYSVLAEKLQANMRIEELEQVCMQELTKSIRALWALPMSIEYAFAFVTTAVNHANFLRTMYIGKKNDLTAQEIAEITPPFISSSIYA